MFSITTEPISTKLGTYVLQISGKVLVWVRVRVIIVWVVTFITHFTHKCFFISFLNDYLIGTCSEHRRRF